VYTLYTKLYTAVYPQAIVDFLLYNIFMDEILFLEIDGEYFSKTTNIVKCSTCNLLHIKGQKTKECRLCMNKRRNIYEKLRRLDNEIKLLDTKVIPK